MEMVTTPHINVGDCWNLVLEKATGRTYKFIRETFKNSMQSDGGILQNDINNFLISYGYTFIDLRKLKGYTTAREVIKMFQNYKTVIASYDVRKNQGHLSYAHEGLHYTTAETDASFDDPVLFIWIDKKELK